MFSHNSGQHRSRTLAFELFRFWLRILGDIRNRKSTTTSTTTTSQSIYFRFDNIYIVCYDRIFHTGLHYFDMFKKMRERHDSPTPRIGESGSRLFEQMNLGGNTAGSKRKYNRSVPRFFTLTSGCIGRH